MGAFNASLRDWGRLGLLLANDGRAGSQQVLPRDYLLDATDIARQPAAFAPGKATPFLGYGYQFWLLPASAISTANSGNRSAATGCAMRHCSSVVKPGAAYFSRSPVFM